MCNVTIFVNTIVSVIDIFLCPVRQRRHLIIEPAEQGLEAVRAGDLRLLGLRQGLIGIIGRLNRVNMALVSIMAEYGVDSVTAQWLVTGYMIVATVVVTCMAFLYRRFHVRTLFFGAAGLSIVGSAMGLVAPSFELLLVARLVQAVGTGIFIPLMMNTILVVTPKNKLGTYLSVGGCMITFGPAFAPVVCGALVTAFGWHSIFVVPIVAMAVLTVLGFFYMKNLETHEAHLDVLSVLLSAVALTVLSFGLTQLTTDGVLAAAALVLAAAMVAVFVVRQLRCAHPLIDLAPMKNRAFWPALILVTIAMMSMFSMSVLLPLYFEGAAGMTAFAAGLVILVPVLANAGATLLGGRIMDKRGEWPLLPLGFGGIAIGFIALVAVAPQLSVPAVFVAMLVMMLVFDWRMGAACLLAAVISIVAMFSMMGGKNAQILGEYQAALDRITKAGTEYVRGIPVVKIFQQTVYSFKAFQEAIEDYSTKAEHYQADICRTPQSVNLTFTEGSCPA